MDKKAGDLVAKAYSIKKEYKKVKSIGSGQNGKVYLYKNKRTNEMFAMKVESHKSIKKIPRLKFKILRSYLTPLSHETRYYFNGERPTDHHMSSKSLISLKTDYISTWSLNSQFFIVF